MRHNKYIHNKYDCLSSFIHIRNLLIEKSYHYKFIIVFVSHIRDKAYSLFYDLVYTHAGY